MSNYKKRRFVPNGSGSRNGSSAGKVIAVILVFFLVITIVPLLASLGNVSVTDPPAEDSFIVTDPTEPPYDVLMEDYVIVASDDFTNPDETLCNLNYGGSYITRQTDADGNGYLLFSDYPTGTASTYVTLRHGLETVDKIVFEFEFCWEDSGLYLAFYSRPEHKQILGACNGALYFHSAECAVTVGCAAGNWYKVTYALDLTTGTYDAYVNEEQFVFDAAVPSGMTQLTSIRLQIDPSSNNNGSDGDFMLDSLKWYLPAEAVMPDPTDPMV